jgi:hypothetical protein
MQRGWWDEQMVFSAWSMWRGAGCPPLQSSARVRATISHQKHHDYFTLMRIKPAIDFETADYVL